MPDSNPFQRNEGREITVITPSTLNVLIIGFSMIIFTFLWRMLAAWLANRDSQIGDAMAVVL